tara:strand:- start:568 stop:699 length:132 start_codon:yes stop_codon:yes gene_type:complete
MTAGSKPLKERCLTSEGGLQNNSLSVKYPIKSLKWVGLKEGSS